MIKIIGVALIVLCGVGAGFYFSAKLSNRVAALQKFTVLIKDISTQIRYRSQSLDQLFKSLDREEYERLSFIKKVADNIKSPHDAPQMVWENAVEKYAATDGFNKKDIELLLQFGAGLGKTDLDGQINHIAMHEIFFDKQLEEAEAEFKNKGKLYLTLGIISGLAAAILFM